MDSFQLRKYIMWLHSNLVTLLSGIEDFKLLNL